MRESQGIEIRSPVCTGDHFRSTPFSFVDFFAGIGGMRIAFENAGGRCVFSSEWDPMARMTYAANFGEEPAGDITRISARDIPDHDVLLAGFPCQPFSIAGVSKYRSLKLPDGFEHVTQGTLFFDVARILKAKRPRAFLLENVKNLKSHDKGKTFSVIEKTLTKDLGYHIFHKVIDAKSLVPQHRERIYIVGFRDRVDFTFPELPDLKPKFSGILEKKVGPKYTLSDDLWLYLQKYARKHRAKGNGFGYGLVKTNGFSRTLSARYYKDGSEILVPQKGKNPRRMTPRECARLMGFPDSFSIIVSDRAAYRQFGNSVVVPVVTFIARCMVDYLTGKAKSSSLMEYVKVKQC